MTDEPFGERQADADQVADVAGVGIRDQRRRDPSVGREQWRVDVGHRLLGQGGEHALQGGQLEDLHIVLSHLAPNLGLH